MNSVICVVLAVLACFAVGFQIPKTEGVYPLTSSNLNMATTGDWLLILYAPWCPHCHSLLDKLSVLTSEIKDSNVKIGIIDADADPSIQMQFSMHGFPTLFRIHDGNAYSHPIAIGRSVEALTKWSTKDYANAEPVTGLKAPFGLPMRAFSAYSNFAIHAYRFLEFYADMLGIPALWFFCGIAFILALVVIVVMIVASRCRRPQKKSESRQKKAKKTDDIVAPIVQQARAENPIEGAAVANTEKVQEQVKKAKEEQKLRRRGTNKDEAGVREQQKRSQKNQGKPSKSVRQQNMPTQQPSKRS